MPELSMVWYLAVGSPQSLKPRDFVCTWLYVLQNVHHSRQMMMFFALSCRSFNSSKMTLVVMIASLVEDDVPLFSNTVNRWFKFAIVLFR